MTEKITFNPEGTGVGEVCIANISPKERQKRMRFGVIQFVIGIVILVALVAFDVNPLWRLTLYLVFSAAAAGYFQAKDKT
jgi:uncharacterized membrane protein